MRWVDNVLKRNYLVRERGESIKMELCVAQKNHIRESMFALLSLRVCAVFVYGFHIVYTQILVLRIHLTH